MGAGGLSLAWAVKATAGYRLENYDGAFIVYPGAAADCKSYCIQESLEAVVINEKTDQITLEKYYDATGKRYINPNSNGYF
jgi:hypothetical protein